jgi:lipopolysaccharide export system protein LptA
MSFLKKSWMALASSLIGIYGIVTLGLMLPPSAPVDVQAAEQFLAMGNTVVIEANEQTVDLKNNISYFKGNVIVSSGETVIKAPRGKVLMDANAQPSVARFEGGVSVLKGKDSLKSSTLVFDFKQEAFTASGGVDTSITPQGKSPVRIQSSTQQYLKERSQMLASGNVVITSSDANATAGQALLVLGANNSAERITFTGDAKLQQKDADVYAQQIILVPKQDVFMAEGNAFTRVIQAGNPKPIILRSAYQQFDRKQGLLIASGSVDLDFEDYKARGPKAVFYMTKGKSMDLERAVFSGRPTLNEGKIRQVIADTIEVTMNPRHFDARGNVKTKLVQKPKTQSASRTSKSMKNGVASSTKKGKPVTEEDEYDAKAFDLGKFETGEADQT